MITEIVGFPEGRKRITDSKIPHPFGSFKAKDLAICADDEGEVIGWMTIQHEDERGEWLVCEKSRVLEENEDIYAAMIDEIIAEDPAYIAVTLSPYVNDYANILIQRDFKKSIPLKTKDGQFTGRLDTKIMYVWSKEPDTYERRELAGA